MQETKAGCLMENDLNEHIDENTTIRNFAWYIADAVGYEEPVPGMWEQAKDLFDLIVMLGVSDGE